MFVLSIVLTSLFSLFYVTREGDRFYAEDEPFFFLRAPFESSCFLASSFSVTELSCSESSSFDSQSILGEERCETVSSSSESSEKQIVYGLNVLRHFSAILSALSSQSPGSATACAGPCAVE